MKKLYILQSKPGHLPAVYGPCKTEDSRNNTIKFFEKNNKPEISFLKVDDVDGIVVLPENNSNLIEQIKQDIPNLDAAYSAIHGYIIQCIKNA